MRTRYRWRNGELVQVEAAKPGAGNIMKDCYFDNPVRSPVDRTVLDSKAKLRDHNARHGCVDVGNDRAFVDPARQGVIHRPDRAAIRDDIRMAMAKHGWGD